jgi:aldehyde:ferredoxin oxidoreductase
MGHALGYATSNRGGCHLTGYMAAMEILAAPKKIPRFTIGGKADLLALKQNQSAVEDSLVTCKFAGFAVGFDFNARFLTAITGLDMNISRLLEIGERIYNLERLFNLKAGLTRKDDSLPKRFIENALKEGLSEGHTVPLEEMLDSYYAVRTWNNDGVPKPKLLEKLGIANE